MMRVVTAAVLALAGTVLAQPAITIDVERAVLMPGESTRVTMYAGYGGADWAIAGVATSLVASGGSEGWSVARLVAPMDDPGTTAGSASATGYDGIIAGQFQDGQEYFADITNPIAFWEATYTAPLSVTQPFDIDVSTMTTMYTVYIHPASARSESRLDELAEGSATIRVIPAPASAVLLGVGVLAMRRRR